MHRSFDLVISDVNLPKSTGGSGVEVLDVVRAYDPDVPLVLMTGSPTAESAIDACRLGVLEYLVKPASREHIVRALGRATRVRRSAIQRREVHEQERQAMGTAITMRPECETREHKHTTPIGAAPPSLSALAMVSSINTRSTRMMRACAATLPPVSAASGRITLVPSSEHVDWSHVAASSSGEAASSSERVDPSDEAASSSGEAASSCEASTSGEHASLGEHASSRERISSIDLSRGDRVLSSVPPARSSRPAAAPVDPCPSSEGQAAQRAAFERAMLTLSVELEPIADGKTKKLLGYASRMFSSEEQLTTEAALVAAAEQLGRLEALRRRVRDLAVKAFVEAPSDALLFVDVHPSDLLDGDLYSPDPPLARIADRVVLQVRTHGLSIEDLSARASVLRFVGFRLAIADLDAAHPHLAQIADLSPEFVKIDARLVRGMSGSTARCRLVGALVSMCSKLDAVSIGEGVSTAEDCEALLEAGCAFVQGSLVVRHSAAAVSSRRGALSSRR
jgi:EAL domain-containing protein (putative c-di-GMP-specific phosphodiesterase class I)